MRGSFARPVRLRRLRRLGRPAACWPSTDLPFWLGFLIGIIATIPLGVLFALPAVRTRGINLAIVTLGLGSAIELMLFGNSDFTGGFGGTRSASRRTLRAEHQRRPAPDPLRPRRAHLLHRRGLVVGQLRRGRTGRRLIAVRTNERAAAALGISVPGRSSTPSPCRRRSPASAASCSPSARTSISYADFSSNFNSITMVAYAMIGGIGYLFGPVIGAHARARRLRCERLLNAIDSGIGKYIPLIGGVSLILLVLLNQNGIAKEQIAQIAWLRSQARASGCRSSRPREPKPRVAGAAVRGASSACPSA